MMITCKLMNKPVYLVQSILEISKIVMYKCRYGYQKPEYVEKTKLCYMDANYFSLHKKQDIHVDIAKDVEAALDASYHVLERPLPSEKNKKVIGIKPPKKFVIKQKGKFKNCKECLESTQIENKKDQLEK